MKQGGLIYLLACCLGLSVFFVACEKNEKLTPLADGDMDAVSEQDIVEGGEVEDVADPVKLQLSKWASPEDSIINVDPDGVLWSLSSAGMIAIDTAGTAADQSDDKELRHSEFSLENWPVDKITGACIDAEGYLWIQTQGDLLLFMGGNTFEDSSDDVLIPVSSDENHSSLIPSQILCSNTGEGLWLKYGAGFMKIKPGDTPEDAALWTYEDFASADNQMAQNPYLVISDSSDNLWMTVFQDEVLKLFVVEADKVTASGTGGIHEITCAPGSCDVANMTADSSDGLWVSIDDVVYHVDHKGTLSDSTDDVWTQLPVGKELGIEAFISIEKGLALGYKSDGQDFYVFDVAAAKVNKLPEFGIDDENVISYTAYHAASGLWYSAQNDFGLLMLSEASVDATWEPQRFFKAGGVPANDLRGFVKLDNGIALGGANGIVKLAYDKDTQAGDFVFEAHEIINPEDPSPIDIKSLDILKGGIVAGGARLAYLDAEGNSSAWNRKYCPRGVNFVTVGYDDYLWVDSRQFAYSSYVPYFYVYDYRGSLNNGDDDKWGDFSNEYIGFDSGVSVNSMIFYDGCKALIANDLGLYHYDCGDAPMDTENFVLETEYLDGERSVRTLKYIAEGSWWVVSLKNGLTYLDTKSTPEASDDEFLPYDTDILGYALGVDSKGLLYYFVDEGLLVHDTAGTPADQTDDLGALIELTGTKSAQIEIDGYDNLWISFGDARGIYFGKVSGSDMLPMSEVFGDDAAVE